jgi:C1A family cysteine protease
MSMVVATRAGERVLNCDASLDTDTDWRAPDAMAAGMLEAAAPVPERIDLREDWWEIGDQGRTGSCVGWATADSALRWHFVQAGRIGRDERLSVRFQWMAAKEIDDFVESPTTFIELAGTKLKAALQVARRWGAVLDDVLPFRGQRLYAGDWKPFYAIASKLRINAYINLELDQADWRRWLATNGPVLARLRVDETWKNASSDGELATYYPATAGGGHAIALVGYTPEMFVVRNSWGTTDWGDQGFAYASNEYVAAAFTEAYGVMVL